MCLRMDANGVTPICAGEPPEDYHCAIAHTNTGTDEYGNLHVEDILGRCAVRAINTDRWESTTSGIDLDEVTAGTVNTIVLLITFQRSLRHGSDHLGTSTNTFTQSIGPITDLADVDGDVRILGSRGDGELDILSVPPHGHRKRALG